MDHDHEEGLDEQRSTKMGAEPVVNFEDAGSQHDERNVKGKTSGTPGAVH